MKQIVSNYSYSPTTNVVTLTGVNIDADQLLLIVAPEVGRTMYNFASVTGSVAAGINTRVTLNASTAGLTTTSPLVIFYDDQLSTQTIAGTVTADISSEFVDDISSSGSATKKLAVQIYDSAGNAIGDDSLPVYAPSALPVSGTVAISNAITASQFFTVVTSQNIAIPFVSGTTSSAFQTGTDYDFVVIKIDSAVSGVTAPSVIINTGISAGTAINPSGNRYGGFYRAWNDTEKTVFNFNSTNIYSSVTKSNKTLIYPAPDKENKYFWLNTLNVFGSVPIGSVDFYACKGLVPQVATDIPDGLMMAGKVPVAGNVWVSNSSITIGNSVTISSLPAISGTVTANLSSVPTHGVTIANTAVTVLAYVQDGTSFGAEFAQGLNNGGGVNVANTVPVSISSVTIGSCVTHGVTITNSSVTVSQSGSVTIGANPSGALTTRFGSVTTANTAQITSAVTNTSRKYLLAQNISAGTVTIGIGFSPTTTQGIQLAAGAGITFDAFCPTGAVYWLGATTGAAFTILEG